MEVKSLPDPPNATNAMRITLGKTANVSSNLTLPRLEVGWFNLEKQPLKKSL